MSPETHLLASWLIAAKATRNPRDCRLVALAGILPDADGLGLLVDGATRLFGARGTFLYQTYHHWLLHGGFGALLVAAILAGFARERWRVAWLAFLVFHLHLLCDFVGSRGPDPGDLWPIHYLGPFSRHPTWMWYGQWRLDGWQNRYLSVALFAWALWAPIRLGHSPVGVFNRRADAVFVAVLRKWHAGWVGFLQRPLIRILKQPPWRTIVPGVLIVLAVPVSYALWQPGTDERSGTHDLRRNGIWLGHGWLGSDDWFLQNGRTNWMHFRDVGRMRELAALLARHNIRDVFPHLCPADPRGSLPPMDSQQAERFLDEFANFRVMPWIGGPNGPQVRHRDPRWRGAFVASVTNLLVDHPRFAGVHLNVEPMTSGDADFLQLLDELRTALPKGKLLSVAAYPPPTRWHPFPDVHWDETYFREVSRRSDQMVVMMYDTALRFPKVYQQLMVDWTTEVLAWSERRPVLLGVPTYRDDATDYHHPDVENLRNALLGIHGALADQTLPPTYQGVAIYCEWETDEAEWSFFREHFVRKSSDAALIER